MTRKVEAAFILGLMLAGGLIGLNMMVSPVDAAGVPSTCSTSVAVTGNTIATAELVALSAGKRVRVCGFVLTGGATTTVTLKTGTGTACATGTTSLTGALALGANTSVSYGGGPAAVITTPASQALCWSNSAAQQVSGVVTYGQY